MSVKLETEAVEVVFEKDAVVENDLRRLTDMFLKDVHDILSKSALFVKYDQNLEQWTSSRCSNSVGMVPEH